MSARTKEGKKKLNGSKKVTEKEKKEKFVLVRDKVTNRVIMARLDEVVSAKPGVKLSLGDTVTHGSRNKKVRGMIILVGNEDECASSLRIIQRTSKSPARPLQKKKKNCVVETFDDVPEDNDGEEEDQDNDDEEDVEEENEEMEEDQHEESDSDLNTNGENALVIENEPDVFEQRDEETSHARGEPLSVISTNTVSTKQTSRKRKNSFDEQSNPRNSKSGIHIGFVSLKDHAKVVEQLTIAHQQNEMYQSTWMPRPTDPKTIDYFIQIGKVLSCDTETVNEKTIEKGELLDSIMATLEMTETELTQYIGRSILSTARQIVGTKYPGEDVVYANVKKEHIKAIVDYCWMIHPGEKRLNDFSKISKAMGNVFAARSYAKKSKTMATTRKEILPVSN